MSTSDRADESDRLAHQFWLVGVRMGLLWEAAFGGTPLSPALSLVLDVVVERPGISIAGVARRLPTSAQAVSKHVSRLEELGLLERRLGHSGYGTALHVTTSGKQAQVDASARKKALDNDLAAALGQRDHDDLIRLLKHAEAVVAMPAAKLRSTGDVGSLRARRFEPGGAIARGERGSATKRAPRGHNRRLILQAIDAEPRLTGGMISDRTGIAKPTAYATLARMTADGILKKQSSSRGVVYSLKD